MNRNITSHIILMQINAKDRHVKFHGQTLCRCLGMCSRNVTIAYNRHAHRRYAKFHNEGNESKDDIKMMFKNVC